MDYFDLPKTLAEAVKALMNELPLKDRVYMAGLKKKDLPLIHTSLAAYIMQDLRLSTGNKNLIDSCRSHSGIKTLTADQAVHVLIEALWQEIKKTHTLRAISTGRNQGKREEKG